MPDDDDGLAAVVLAAGEGRRLRPLTSLRPKAMCPVAGIPLVDWALARVAPHVDPGSIAVNAHALRQQLTAHLGGRAHVSVEEDVALGTAGAVANLAPWIAGRGVLVTNADSWCEFDLGRFVTEWDRERIRLLVTDDPTGSDFGPWRYAGTALLPWVDVAGLPIVPSGLYETTLRQAEADGRLDLVPLDGPWFDCGTPWAYLAANLTASGGRSVCADPIPDGAVVERSVVWDGALVAAGEILRDAIRPRAGWTIHVGSAA